MFNFCQFWNQINGEPYHNVPPPVQYDMQDYGKAITSSPISNVEGGNADLRPIEYEDMGRYAADDVVSHYAQKWKGKNPYSLGEPMSDGAFKKHMGQTW